MKIQLNFKQVPRVNQDCGALKGVRVAVRAPMNIKPALRRLSASESLACEGTSTIEHPQCLGVWAFIKEPLYKPFEQSEASCNPCH